MSGKELFLVLISFLMSTVAFGQDNKVGMNYTRSFVSSFSSDNVYYKETGQKIPLAEFRRLMQENPKIYFEREIDEEGTVLRYYYSPNNQIKRGNGVFNFNVSENVAFPNFKLNTIDKKEIELKKISGKLVILRFETEAKGYRFKKQDIELLDKKINALSKKEDVEAIIIFQSAEDDVREGFDLANSNFKPVANGIKFMIKYAIRQYPSTLLIDQNGILIGYFSDLDSLNLEEYIK